MNTKLIMTSSALLMAVLGILSSFLPHEILDFIGEQSSGVAPLFVQVMAALYLGFASMNWMSKAIIIGGIYARPLALGNFFHFFIGALALGKGASAHGNMIELWIASGIYALFAIAFGLIVFTHPLKEQTSIN